jgi:uncharacterized SAM-binding protein YcdF (DUF218 family)
VAGWRQPRRSLKLLRWLGQTAPILACLWLGAFLHFAASVPRQGAAPDRATDAIVVLTGGAARLDVGIELLGQGWAKRLFVSGVNPGIGKSIMQAKSSRPELFDCCIDLGFAADDTVGNAIEIEAWTAIGQYRSLRVVTASYHMPRALVELRRRLAEVELVAHPVFPEHVKLEQWWLWPGTASLLAVEFQKYFVALARARLEDLYPVLRELRR